MCLVKMSQNKLIVQQRYISHTFKVPFNDHAVWNTYYSINIINNFNCKNYYSYYIIKRISKSKST